MLSSEWDGLTTFHCYSQSLPSCLFYIEHILPTKAHPPTTLMHTLTTRGRFCAAKEPHLWFLSAHCLHLIRTHTERRTLSEVAAVAAAQITLSLLDQSGASQVHVFLNTERIHWSIHILLIYTVNPKNISDKNKFLCFSGCRRTV